MTASLARAAGVGEQLQGLALAGSAVCGRDPGVRAASPRCLVPAAPPSVHGPQPRRRGARGGARHRVQLADAALQRGLRALDDVDLAATLRVRTPTLQSVPGWMRGLLAFALRSGLRLIRGAPGTAAAREAVGWKLFLLAPRMLLSAKRGSPQLSSSEEQACSGRASGPSCCSRSGPRLEPDPARPRLTCLRRGASGLRRWRT